MAEFSAPLAASERKRSSGRRSGDAPGLNRTHERVRDPHCSTMGGLSTEMAVECLAAGLPRPQPSTIESLCSAPGLACLVGGGEGERCFGPAAAAGFPTLFASALEIQKAETVKPPRGTQQHPPFLASPCLLVSWGCRFLVQQAGTRPPLTAGLRRGHVGQRAQHVGPALRQGPKQMLQRWHRRESSGRCH